MASSSIEAWRSVIVMEMVRPETKAVYAGDGFKYGLSGSSKNKSGRQVERQVGDCIETLQLSLFIQVHVEVAGQSLFVLRLPRQITQRWENYCKGEG